MVLESVENLIKNEYNEVTMDNNSNIEYDTMIPNIGLSSDKGTKKHRKMASRIYKLVASLGLLVSEETFVGLQLVQIERLGRI